MLRNIPKGLGLRKWAAGYSYSDPNTDPNLQHFNKVMNGRQLGGHYLSNKAKSDIGSFLRSESVRRGNIQNGTYGNTGVFDTMGAHRAYNQAINNGGVFEGYRAERRNMFHEPENPTSVPWLDVPLNRTAPQQPEAATNFNEANSQEDFENMVASNIDANEWMYDSQPVGGSTNPSPATEIPQTQQGTSVNMKQPQVAKSTQGSTSQTVPNYGTRYNGFDAYGNRYSSPLEQSRNYGRNLKDQNRFDTFNTVMTDRAKTAKGWSRASESPVNQTQQSTRLQKPTMSTKDFGIAVAAQMPDGSYRYHKRLGKGKFQEVALTPEQQDMYWKAAKYEQAQRDAAAGKQTAIG